MTEQPSAAWRAILPVKALARAKSRMAAGIPTTADLAFAFFQDTLAAIQECPAVGEVVVVTADPLVSGWARDRACSVISDVGHPGINPAARLAAGSDPPECATAVVVSDLPCLLPDSLAEVLRLAHGHPTSFIADADGSGTTIWLCMPGEVVDPLFGVQSRAAHRSAGAVDLVALHPDRAAILASARLDVDTASALANARELGLGPHTRQLLAAAGEWPAGEVIVTVAASDDTRLTLVDESGISRSVPWELAAGAGLIHARPGQRLAAVMLPTGVIAALRLP